MLKWKRTNKIAESIYLTTVNEIAIMSHRQTIEKEVHNKMKLKHNVSAVYSANKRSTFHGSCLMSDIMKESMRNEKPFNGKNYSRSV